MGVERSHTIKFNNKLSSEISSYRTSGETQDALEESIGMFYSDSFNDYRKTTTNAISTEYFDEFGNRLYMDSITGELTTTPYFSTTNAVKVVDDGRGGLDLVLIGDNQLYNPPIRQVGIDDTTTPVIEKGKYGTIDYQTGEVVIPRLRIGTEGLSLTDGLITDPEYLYFYVEVDENDVFPDFNQIITILDTDIKVTMIEDRI